MAKILTPRRHYFLFALTVVLIGANLRPIMAAVSPLLDVIQAATGMSDATAGLLTALPVLAMGVVALLGGVLQRVLGIEKTILLGLIAVGLASLVRVAFYDQLGLVLTACVGGVGIAVIQAVLPGLIKRDYSEHAGRLMLLYTAGIMAGAMLASVSVAPLAQAVSWTLALAVWGGLALIALVSWSMTPRVKHERGQNMSVSLPWRSPRAWYLLIFFGIGTSAYTLVLAWLPPFYLQLGWSGSTAGLMLGGLTLVQVIAAIGLSLVVDRFTDRRPLLLIILVTIGLGLCTLIIAPESLALLAITLLGFGIGALFPMSLVVTLDHLQQASQAGALMGFVQGGGYIIASIMPFLGGILRDEFNTLSLAWGIMLGGIALQALMVVRLSPQQVLSVSDWRLQPRGN